MAGTKRVSVPLPSGEQIRLTDKNGDPDFDALELVNESTFLYNKAVQEKLYAEMYKAKIENAPILTSGGSLNPLERTKNLEDVTITLANIPLIDVNDSPWEQILELRKDKKALNRLRMHLAATYIDLPREQVEAKLLQDMENYKLEADKHGFNLGAGLLQATLDAKTLLGSIGGGAFLGNLLGGHGMAAGAAVGLCLEIGKISISAAKGVYDVRQLKQHHPLSYVIKAQSTLQS